MSVLAGTHAVPQRDFFSTSAGVLTGLIIAAFLGGRYFNVLMRRSLDPTPEASIAERPLWSQALDRTVLNVGSLMEWAVYFSAVVGLFSALNALATKPSHDLAGYVFQGLAFSTAALSVVLVRGAISRREEQGASPRALVAQVIFEIVTFILLFVFFQTALIPAAFRL